MHLIVPKKTSILNAATWSSSTLKGANVFGALCGTGLFNLHGLVLSSITIWNSYFAPL